MKMFENRYFYLIFCTVILGVFDLYEANEHIITFPGDVRGRSNSSYSPFKDNDDNDPCAPYNPRTPNFSRPGRRISSVKCYEFIWQMKVRNEKIMRERDCAQSRLRDDYVPESIVYVIGGHTTLAGEFPNMGAIGWQAIEGGWVFMCGSSLISPKFVLTAAHCSFARDSNLVDPEPKVVRLGERNLLDSFYSHGEKPNDANIIRIINHPNYRAPKQYFDIALMELGKEVKFTKDLQPVCLWTEPEVLKYGRHAQIAGWGVVRSGSREGSKQLLAANVDIIETEQCNKLLMPNCNRNWCGLNNQICAGKLAGGVDSCQGDSGGPLQAKIPLPISGQGSMHYLIGVTSFGIGCGLPNLPGVYTRVSSFIDWIEKIVWK